MDIFTTRKHRQCKSAVVQRLALGSTLGVSGLKLPALPKVVPSALVWFVLIVLVWGAAGAVEFLNAAEPQNPTPTMSQSDGRFLGYTRLREGTRVPATLGTVVALGPRRWAFIPAARPVVEMPQPVTQSESVEITVTQQNGTVTRRVDSLTLSTKVPAGRGSAAASALRQAVDSDAEQENREQIVLITENLMLQRIVQAVTEDELDSSWQVTGQVTEYFGENRLTILTAQRAQAKQLAPAVER